MRTIIAFILSAIISVILPGPAMADEFGNGRLTTQEIDFLVASCPESNRIVNSGAAVVYGNILRPPILITRNRDRVFLNGLQVLPRPKAVPAWEGLFAKILELNYAQHAAHQEEALPALKRRLDSMKAKGDIDDFSIEKKKFWGLTLSKGERHDRLVLEGCPPSVIEKNTFIISTLLRGYAVRRDEIGKQSALSWLSARFDALVKSGMLDKYSIAREDETAKVKFACELFTMNYGFDARQNNKSMAYDREWKAKEPTTKKELDRIGRLLEAGGIMVYSHAFEREEKSDVRLLSAFEDLGHQKDTPAALRVIHEFIDVPKQHEAAFLEEFQ